MTHDTLMALATVYADCVYCDRNVDEARAALSAAIAELIAERDALAKDAARYRWLKDNCHEFKPADYDGLPYGRHHIDLLRTDEWDIDVAVDAAMPAYYPDGKGGFIKAGTYHPNTREGKL